MRRLISGPGVFICDGCVALCNQVISDGPPPAPHRGWIARRLGRRKKPIVWQEADRVADTRDAGPGAGRRQALWAVVVDATTIIFLGALEVGKHMFGREL